MLRRDLSSNRLARRRTPPVGQQLAPPARAENPPGTASHQAGRGRSWTCGTGRTGFDLATVRGSRPQGQFDDVRRRGTTNRRSSRVSGGKSGRHAEAWGEPVENRLPGRSPVVRFRAPSTPEKWTSAPKIALAHPAHPVDKGVDRQMWTKQT